MLTARDVLGPGGRIAARLKSYEFRPEQLEMAEAVSAALSQGHHLLAEAGTGVGKSFAYLVPAIIRSAGDEQADEKPANRRRVVVSTHTISLQEQLINKDIPFLRSVLPLEFTALLVKGRRNYLSRRRLDTALGRAESMFHEPSEFDELRRIRDWARTTTDGSLSDLPHRPLGSVWDEVASDSGNCMGRKCPTFERCFYYAARRRVQNAQVLVVNHALYFSDLALRRSGISILPEHDTVIFDEAHTLEAVAGEHLGLSVTSGQVEYTLNKLYNDRTNKGLLVHHGCVKSQHQVSNCYAASDDFFADLLDWQQQRKSANGRVRLPGIVDDPLSPALAGLADLVKRDAERIDDDSQRHDLMAASERLYALAGEITQWQQPVPGRCRLLAGCQPGTPRPAAHRIVGCPHRCGSHAARTTVQPLAERHPDQCHVVDGPQAVVRLPQAAHRADAV